jgi:DNA repair protein RecN (Recombination protein N)
MLKRLRIQGFALFEDVELELAPGLNVISGETGAGKSLVLSALALLCGARTGPWPLREGCEQSEVCAQFAVPGPGETAISAADERALSLRRIRRRSGKGACYLGADVMGARRAAELGRTLAEFAFQHAQLELDSGSAFLSALDAFAGQTALCREYADVYAELVEVQREAALVESQLNGRELRERRLLERMALLERLAPAAGEHGELRARLSILGRARDFLEHAAQVRSALCEREGSVEDELSALVRGAGRSEEAPLGVRSLIEALQRAASEVQEAARAASRLELELDVQPAELLRLERRCAELERAAEALAVDPDELAPELLRLGGELASLQAAEARIGELEARRTRAFDRARELARVLHERRSRAASELSRRLEAELAELCLPDARWSLELGELAGDALNALGMSTLRVSFAANPGEPFGPLARVASGGERSRLLLALRALGIGARAGAHDTLVFDEVDAGVGGEAAEAVALRLVRLASLRQVIVVTHQATIAACASAHFRVHKQTRDGRTRAHVERLPAAGRVDELARMLSGRAQDESARTLALTMLERAEARSVERTSKERRHKGRHSRAWSGRAA